MLTSVTTAVTATVEQGLLASQFLLSNGAANQRHLSSVPVSPRDSGILFLGRQSGFGNPYAVRLSSGSPSGRPGQSGQAPPPAGGSGGGDGGGGMLTRIKTPHIINIKGVGDAEIQIASESDAEEILALQKQAYQSEAILYDDYNIPPLTQSLDDLRSQFQNYRTIKVVIDGKIIGSARGVMKDGTCYIGRVMVHPEYQGKGIGTELMREIERRFLGAERFDLFVGARSEGNIRLYTKLGYKIYKTERQSEKTDISYMEKRNERP